MGLKINNKNISEITFLFITYNRPQLLARALHALNNVSLEIGISPYLIVSDDGSTPENLDLLYRLNFDEVLTTDKNSGLGANQNKGLARCFTQYILQIQDDWIFTGNPNDLSRAIEIMNSDPTIGVLQLTKTNSDLPVNFKKFGSSCYKIFANDGLPWNRNCSVRPYSDNPHLKRRDFVLDVGPYLEGVPMTICENDFKKRVATQNKWKIAEFCCDPMFEHLGADVSMNSGGNPHKILRLIKKIPFVGNLLVFIIRRLYYIIDNKLVLVLFYIKKINDK